jgi:predicted small secreted protein
MAAAMKQTGDKPPLKKSTITKAHDIAKSVKENAEEIDESSIKVGDKVHAGLGVKGGAGYRGVVSKIDNDKIHINIGSGKYGDRIVSAPHKNVTKEEVEQVDEISTDLANRYLRKTNPEYSSPKETEKRKPGRALALKKKWGGKVGGTEAPKVSTTEEYENFNSGAEHGAGSTEQMQEASTFPIFGESDDESAEMAKTQLRALANKALHLAMQLNDDQVVEPWVQSKIAVAKDYVTAVHDYMLYGDHESKSKENEQTAPYDGGIDMTGAPRNTYPSFSADVNTGRVV